MDEKKASPAREWHYRLPEIGREIDGIRYSVGIGIFETEDGADMTAICEVVKEDLAGNSLGSMVCGSVSEAVKYLNALERRTEDHVKDRLGHFGSAVHRAQL